MHSWFGPRDAACVLRTRKNRKAFSLALIAEGGHWMGEDAVQKALLKAMREFE